MDGRSGTDPDNWIATMTCRVLSLPESVGAERVWVPHDRFRSEPFRGNVLAMDGAAVDLSQRS
jgi:hypothetical protein